MKEIPNNVIVFIAVFGTPGVLIVTAASILLIRDGAVAITRLMKRKV